MWVFGYGSLIWKVDFPFRRKTIGFIEGFHRRFWQGSTDHRGVPGKPGRVVTLVKSENPREKVWGIAYEISPEDEENVKAHLDHREKGGYSAVEATFHSKDEDESFLLNLYLANDQNKNYLGPASVVDIANQVFNSVGPSGRNIDYVLNLAKAVREIAPHEEDMHLFDLEKELLILIKNYENNDIVRSKVNHGVE